jgi:hypothetical protein
MAGRPPRPPADLGDDASTPPPQAKPAEPKDDGRIGGPASLH